MNNKSFKINPHPQKKDYGKKNFIVIFHFLFFPSFFEFERILFIAPHFLQIKIWVPPIGFSATFSHLCFHLKIALKKPLKIIISLLILKYDGINNLSLLSL